MTADVTPISEENPGLTSIFEIVRRMLSELQLPVNGFEVTLTGRQINHIRTKLGESQLVFARRLGVSQGTVFRLERHGDKPATGPDVILISLIAIQHRIDIPTEFSDDAEFADGDGDDLVEEAAVEGE